MSTITKALVMEHAVFCAAFDQFERVLPKVASTREVKFLATVAEGMLSNHAETEKIWRIRLWIMCCGRMVI